jgi:phage terminase small subunit
MTPINFKEANKTLLKPDNMTDEDCTSLRVYTNGMECVSKWKLSKEDLDHCKKRGYIWISVFSGKTQPPISVTAQEIVFK